MAGWTQYISWIFTVAMSYDILRVMATTGISRFICMTLVARVLG